MLEARLAHAALLKKLLDSIKELVTDANFECNEEGINLQAMDNSHVALVSVALRADGFKKYRCDRPMPLGVSLNSLTKVLKCAKDEDQVTLKAGDNNDVLNLLYESPSTDRIAEYEMKLLDIDADQLGIPDTEYDANVTMASAEFSRIVKDLTNLGESVRLEVTKEGIRFTSEGDAANGSVLLKHSEAAAKVFSKQQSDASGSGSDKKQKKKANGAAKVKTEDDDDDEEMKDGEEQEEEEVEKANGEDDEDKEDKEVEEVEQVEDEDEEDEEEEGSKKRKKKSSKSEKSSKKAKKDKEDEQVVEGVVIRMNQAVNLTFSLKYLNSFTKSTPLSKNVKLSMSNEVPLLVTYDFGNGSIAYYLAPKIGEE